MSIIIIFTIFQFSKYINFVNFTLHYTTDYDYKSNVRNDYFIIINGYIKTRIPQVISD